MGIFQSLFWAQGIVPLASGHTFLDAQKSMEKRRAKEGCFRAPLWKHPADAAKIRGGSLMASAPIPAPQGAGASIVKIATALAPERKRGGADVEAEIVRHRTKAN